MSETLTDHLSIMEVNHTLRVRRDRRIVRDEDHRNAARAMQLSKQRHDLLAGLRIEVTGRLVGQA